MAIIHPDVKNALLYADTVQDHILTHIDKMKAIATDRLSDDRDIAVKVDMNGQIKELWLKPGILDSKPAAEIAKEITRLVTSAAQESVDQVMALYHAAHEFPDFDTVVASQETEEAADPELVPGPR